MTPGGIPWALRALLLAASVVGLGGCVEHKVDGNQFDEAMAKLDRLRSTVDVAIHSITKEVAACRKTLTDLESKIREDGQDLLANEVRNLAAKFSDDLRIAGAGTFDYLEAKLKDNLKALRQAIDEARAKVMTARKSKDRNGIKRALDELVRVKVFHDPTVVVFSPPLAELRWKDPAQKTGYTVRVPLIEVRGWGFERPADEPPRFGLSVIGADGKERPLSHAAVFGTTRYLMQLKLDVPEVQFARGDRALVFTLGPSSADRRLLPIDHKVPPAPPDSPPPEVVTGVVVVLQTTGDNKEPWSRLQLSLYDNGVELVHEHGPIGEGVRWSRGHARTPYRGGDPDANLVRQLEVARRAAEKAAALARKYPDTMGLPGGYAYHAARCEAKRLVLEEQVEESRPLQAAALTRPIPVQQGRMLRLHAVLESVQGRKKDDWDATLTVSLHTSRGRRLDLPPVSHRFETYNNKRMLDHTITLPEPQP